MKKTFVEVTKVFLVDANGFEPLTTRTSSECSTS